MDILRALDAVEKLETRLSRFYKNVNEAFAADSEVAGIFFQLALEKKSHADLVGYQRRLVRKSQDSFSDVALDMGRIEETIHKIEKVIGADETPPLDDVIRLALEVESDAIAYHHRTAMEQANPNLSRLVQSLAGVEGDHLSLLQKLYQRLSTGHAERTLIGLPISAKDREMPEPAPRTALGSAETASSPGADSGDAPHADAVETVSLPRGRSGKPVGEDLILHALADATDDTIYALDAEYRYVFVNTRHAERLGLPPEDIMGRTYREFHSAEEFEVIKEGVARVFDEGMPLLKEHRSSRDAGIYMRWFQPATSGGGRITAVLVVSRDVTDVRHMEEALRLHSLSDAMTGLYNRKGLFTFARHFMMLARRHGKSFAVLVAAVSDFERIHEEFGTEEGDFALVLSANLLRATFRASDVIARVGRAEFAVLLVDTGRSAADIFARLNENISSHNEQSNRRYNLSFSMGIAEAGPGDESSIDDLLLAAAKSRTGPTS